jgi:uncharacterized ferritin-like protein (DUF455 family)
MEIREFAEQVLFATLLEDKLRAPGELSDERPGPALVTPAAPGRPASLIFKPHGTGDKSAFPGLHRLEDDHERGRLLHFFGNHELLATELMALVLLKFPDAPPAFRQGVLKTLQDEQEHTRLYMERMKSCGIRLGDFPVSGYFWRCIAPMQHPIDYVAGLCLTFEQANLDFAGHYGKALGIVGDAASANLLEKICRDEIGHVAYGLKWFRRWKHPGESDWDAFCRTLKFPLSPQRAKGFSLNVAGRKAAGLDENFISQLNVYSQSKGRTPSVFVFNAFAEGRIAEGKKFNPTKPQAQLVRDLENLPQFLCRQDDIVLVGQKPSVEFLSGIKQAGFPLPEFVELESSSVKQIDPLSPAGEEGQGEGATIQHQNAHPSPRPSPLRGERERTANVRAEVVCRLQPRKLGSLRPWAWGPDSFELLKPLFASVTGERRRDESRFNEKIAQLYSKAWSAEFLRRFIRSSRGDEALTGKTDSRKQKPEISQSLVTSAATQNWLCTENEIGVAVSSMDAALAAIAKIRARGHHNIVLKESFGVAGSNALRLLEPEILPAQRRWMENAFAHKRELVVEPWLERLADFSAQLEMTERGLKLCGFTGLTADARGQFVANYAGPHFHKRLPGRIISLFEAKADLSGVLLEFYHGLFAALETELRTADFAGPIGIDAFVYRDASGAVKLKPVVEINPRYTMGRVLVELMRQVCQNSSGTFRLVNPAQLRAEGFADFPAYAKSLAEKSPLLLEGEPMPRIREGALCLNDPATARVCLAVFQVSRREGE